MGFLSAFRADRLIAEIRESGDPESPAARKPLERLKGLGGSAIDPILAALSTADKKETVAFVDVLIGLIDNKTFPRLAQALAEENGRTVAGVAWALASARN